MMYFDPLIKIVIFYPKFAFFLLILPISRTSCQEKSATNLSGKKVLLPPKFVSEISLLAKPCQEKSATPVKTDQEKHATRLNLSGKKMLLSHLIDLIDFRSSNMFCLTSFKLSSSFLLIIFGWSSTFFLTRSGK